jgi:hypothetical protein
MAEVVGSFSVGKLSVSWINALTAYGYLVITLDSSLDDFVKTWELGARIQTFLRTNEVVKAEAIGLHYLDLPGCAPRLFVLPRYANDVDNSDLLYDQLEDATPARVSTSDVILPLISDLQAFLQSDA